MAKSGNPRNQGGGSNRQGPKITKSSNRGPIIGKMTSVTGSTQPWHPNKGTNKGLSVKKKG